jgi:hypothetical protein
MQFSYKNEKKWGGFRIFTKFLWINLILLKKKEAGDNDNWISLSLS